MGAWIRKQRYRCRRDPQPDTVPPPLPLKRTFLPLPFVVVKLDGLGNAGIVRGKVGVLLAVALLAVNYVVEFGRLLLRVLGPALVPLLQLAVKAPVRPLQVRLSLLRDVVAFRDVSGGEKGEGGSRDRGIAPT